MTLRVGADADSVTPRCGFAVPDPPTRVECAVSTSFSTTSSRLSTDRRARRPQVIHSPLHKCGHEVESFVEVVDKRNALSESCAKVCGHDPPERRPHPPDVRTSGPDPTRIDGSGVSTRHRQIGLVSEPGDGDPVARPDVRPAGTRAASDRARRCHVRSTRGRPTAASSVRSRPSPPCSTGTRHRRTTSCPGRGRLPGHRTRGVGVAGRTGTPRSRARGAGRTDRRYGRCRTGSPGRGCGGRARDLAACPHAGIDPRRGRGGLGATPTRQRGRSGRRLPRWTLPVG
jgi:hypothetical protein